MKTKPFQETFGTIVEPNGSTEVMQLDREEIAKLFKNSGVLLFRGFDNDVKGFEKFSNLFSDNFMTYMGGGYKRKVVDEAGDKTIMSVNYYLGSPVQSTFALPLHGEMYYIEHRPQVIWFYCVAPALQDGETTLCDGAELYRQLSDSTRELFGAQRLKYIRSYEPADWQKRFQTEDIDVVEEFCLHNGMQVELDRQKQTVRTIYLHPATVRGAWNNDTIFINNILPVVWQERNGSDTNIVRLEDGSEIPAEVIDEILEVSGRLTKLIAWNQGEIAMLDNTWILHGRRRFDDDVRQLYSRMASTVSL